MGKDAAGGLVMMLNIWLTTTMNGAIQIESTINNVQQACDLVEEWGSLATYFWQYEPTKRPSRFDYATLSQLSKTPESIALSKDLKSGAGLLLVPSQPMPLCKQWDS